ncbi:NAD-dependent protein deacetylase sirtuin-2 [Borealophlyctis nickersoniae]|nr:NAD-dependent protein deacetylase sirtuin-2 [Borealophlyctis nickersoniae]
MDGSQPGSAQGKGPEWTEYREPAAVADDEDETPVPASASQPEAKQAPRRSPRKPSPRKTTPKKTLTPLEQKLADPSLNIIPDDTVESIAAYIKEKGCKNIIVMTGAGISTSAGIPDFRSPGTGLYDNLQKYNLPYPTAVFDINYFRRKPEPFFTLARELYPGNFRPTTCHYFIRLLAEKGLLLRNYTQNIDTLERVAGISGEYLVEAHGSFSEAHCVGWAPPRTEESELLGDSDSEEDVNPVAAGGSRGCGRAYSQKWVKDQIFAGNTPRCQACNGLVKPDIVFFGESLPDRFHSLLVPDFIQCDLLIVIGTSLQVMPFASLINRVPDTVPRLLINREFAGVHFSRHSGFDFVGDVQNYRRDAVYLGSCDDGCTELASLLGWGDELKQLTEREHARLAQEEEVAHVVVSTESAEEKAEEVTRKIGDVVGEKPEDEKAGEPEPFDEVIDKELSGLLEKQKL